MTTASPAGLDDFLTRFTTQVDSGFGLISGDVQGVLATLVIISVAATAILWAIDEKQNILPSLIRKVLLVGFFAWLLSNWHTLSVTVVTGFGQLGLKASGAASIGDFMAAPTNVTNAGVKVCVVLISYIGRLCSQNAGFGALFHLDAILVAAVAAIGVLIAFLLLAVEIAVTIVEFHIVTLIAFVTVPFGVLTQTSFLSERAIGYVVSVGLKFMALAIIIGIGLNIFNSYTVSTDPTVPEEAGLLLAAIFMVMLSLKVPAIAGALISGGPQLNSGSALAGAAGLAAGVAGVGLAGRAAGAAVSNGWAQGGRISAARAASSTSNSGGAPAGAPGAAQAAASPSGASSSPPVGASASGAGLSIVSGVRGEGGVGAAEGPRAAGPTDASLDDAVASEPAATSSVDAPTGAGAGAAAAGPSGLKGVSAAQVLRDAARAPVSSAVAYGRAFTEDLIASRSGSQEDQQAAGNGATEDLAASANGMSEGIAASGQAGAPPSTAATSSSAATVARVRQRQSRAGGIAAQAFTRATSAVEQGGAGLGDAVSITPPEPSNDDPSDQQE